MKQEANNHQRQIEKLVQNLSQSVGLSLKVSKNLQEKEHKDSQMVQTYLGEDPMSS